MCFLRVLHFAVVAPRRGRHVLVTEHGRRVLTRRVDCLVRERRGVRTHVGDPTLFVQPLGGPHRSLGVEAQLAAGLDLQGGRHERGLRALRARRRGHRVHHQVLTDHRGREGRRLVAGHGSQRALRFEFTRRVEVLAGRERHVVDALERRVELRLTLAQGRRHVTPRRRAKGQTLSLSLTDQSNRHRLHPPGRSGLVDGAPQHRRHFVADESVEESASLLSVDQTEVQLAGLGDGLRDRGRSDLVEDHSLHGNFGTQQLSQMPGNRLTLTVFVRGEVELVHLF